MSIYLAGFDDNSSADGYVDGRTPGVVSLADKRMIALPPVKRSTGVRERIKLVCAGLRTLRHGQSISQNFFGTA